MVASESMSVVQMRGLLRERLTWLQWMPACLFALGLMELALDVWFTLDCALNSRIHWGPFSGVGYVKKKNRVRTRFLIEILP